MKRIQAATVDATLYFSPASTSTTVGNDFNLVAKINPGSNTTQGVNAVELHITFNPAILQLDSITRSSAFGTTFTGPTIDNNGGTASIVVMTPSQPDIKATADIATFAFHALAIGTTSPVNITTASNAAVNDGNGTYVVATRTGAAVTVINADTSAPSGGSISYTNGYQTSTTVALTVGDGTDASGINTSSRIVQRKESTLSGGSCGSFGTFAAITPGGTYPNLTDSTVSSGKCYQYQYLVSDSASPSNQATYSSASVIKIDTVAPSGGSLSYTDGNYTAASVALTVNDGSDSISGINTSSRTVQRRSATLTGTNCGTYGSWGTISFSGTYPNLTDASVSSGNCYQYRYLISDAAGNQATFTPSRTAKVDTVAPTLTQITAVANVSRDTTPSYTFSSNEGGTISYSGGCTSSTTAISAGTETTITFNSLTKGSNYSCAVRVADAFGNQSSALNLSFAITYPGDLNIDRSVNLSDLSILAADYGKTSWCGPTHATDINGDCAVNLSDLSLMATDYGDSF